MQRLVEVIPFFFCFIRCLILCVFVFVWFLLRHQGVSLAGIAVKGDRKNRDQSPVITWLSPCGRIYVYKAGVIGALVFF